MRFKVGDIINYGFYSNIKIVGYDADHYHLMDSVGNTKRIYIYLVDKHGKLAN